VIPHELATNGETLTSLTCTYVKSDGERCASTFGLDAEGRCVAHQPGGQERLREIAHLGGEATKAKNTGAAFTADQLPAIETLDDASKALDAIRVAVLTRRISHNEANAASKAIDSWVKAQTATMTRTLVDELRTELEQRTKEIEALRKQLAARAKAAA